MAARRRMRLVWLGSLILAVAALTLLANLPRSFGKGGLFSEAGFPLIYAAWWNDELTQFSTVALIVNLAIPAVAITALGWLVWRSAISGESEAKASGDSRPPLAEEEPV